MRNQNCSQSVARVIAAATVGAACLAGPADAQRPLVVSNPFGIRGGQSGSFQLPPTAFPVQPFNRSFAARPLIVSNPFGIRGGQSGNFQLPPTAFPVQPFNRSFAARPLLVSNPFGISGGETGQFQVPPMEAALQPFNRQLAAQASIAANPFGLGGGETGALPVLGTATQLSGTILDPTLFVNDAFLTGTPLASPGVAPGLVTGPVVGGFGFTGGTAAFAPLGGTLGPASTPGTWPARTPPYAFMNPGIPVLGVNVSPRAVGRPLARGARMAVATPTRSAEQRNALRVRQNHMVSGSLVKADANGAYVRISVGGVAAVRRYALSDVLFQSGRDIKDLATGSLAAAPGTPVLVPDTTGRIL